MNLFPRPLNIVSESEPAAPPAVSVIVTLYNYGRFIEDCLDSIAAQTQGNMELVVVDDFSTDDSLMRVLKWLETNARKFTGFRVAAHLENMGLSYARNTAFGLARADRVFVMDADNMLYPRAIERCMQAMDASGMAGAYTQLEIFGDRTGVGEADFWDKNSILDSPQEIQSISKH
jgi:glycosyltransferase involved in cell wall biosynthesis